MTEAAATAWYGVTGGCANKEQCTHCEETNHSFLHSFIHPSILSLYLSLSLSLHCRHFNTYHSIKVGFLFGTACSLDFGALDTRPLQVLGEVRATPQKVFVVIAIGIGTSGEAHKAIQV